MEGRRQLRAACLGVLALLAIAIEAFGQQPAPSSQQPDREFALAAYIWGAELEGSVGSDRASADVHASFSDILEDLNVGVMVAGGARVGRFVGLFDGIWLDLEDEVHSGTLRVGPVRLGPAEIDVELREAMADLKLGYRVLQTEAAHPISVDLLGGGRYWYVRSQIDADFALLADRNFDESVDWVDPIVGARVIAGLTPDLQLVVIGDVGGWDVGSASHRTWQLMGLLGVKFSDTWSLRAGYRVLDVDRDLTDLQLRGPIVGTVYRF